MGSKRNVFIAALVLAGVLVFFVATRSSGNDNDDVKTTSAKNCPPVARMDAVATTPNAPVSIDVLANDTDPDGDPLVFQILETTGGTSTVDDGATPTDASDDRVLFTPANPAPTSAIVEYQAIDPRGAIGASTVDVSINDLGTLPDDKRSEEITTDDTTEPTLAADRCGDTSSTTEVADSTTSTTGSSTTTILVEGETAGDGTTATTTRRGTTRTTTRKPSSSKATTTTAKKSTTTTADNGGPQPTSPPPTTAKPTTTQPSGPTTTAKPPPDCGPQPPYGPGPQPSPEWVEWANCYNGD